MDVFKINVSASMKQLEELRTKFTSLGKDTSQIDSLKAKLEGLNKLTFAQAQQEFSKNKNSNKRSVRRNTKGYFCYESI